MNEKTSGAVNLHEYEQLARTVLDRKAYEYFAGFAGDGISHQGNLTSYKGIALLPRVLVDVRERQKSVNLFGRTLSMPVLIAPTAFQAMAHPDGELATARAAEAMGIVMCLSTLANHSIEEVTAASKADIWFQLYVYKDKGVTKSLVQRAEAAGCLAIVVTVDSPLLGQRENDRRNQFCLPPHLRIRNVSGSAQDTLSKETEESGLASYVASLYDPSLTWKDCEWLCSLTTLPVLVKGVLRADDAGRAIKSGASGIIVSNHGGRQLDSAIAPIQALPRVVQAVGEQTTILVDGGIRRGTDIVKALALGAKAVLVWPPGYLGTGGKWAGRSARCPRYAGRRVGPGDGPGWLSKYRIHHPRFSSAAKRDLKRYGSDHIADRQFY